MTARTNRQKSDQDPAEWMPPAPDARCRYVGEWVATKLRWQLTADAAELEALKVFADGPCEDSVSTWWASPPTTACARPRWMPVKAGFRARVLLDYSVGVSPETTASTLEDFRRAGVAVSGEAPVSQ